MTSMRLLLSVAVVLVAAACDQSRQDQDQGSAVQLPGEPPTTTNAALTIPPDVWAAPPRRAETAQAATSDR